MSRADEILSEWERIFSVAAPSRGRARLQGTNRLATAAAVLVVIVFAAGALRVFGPWLAPAAGPAAPTTRTALITAPSPTATPLETAPSASQSLSPAPTTPLPSAFTTTPRPTVDASETPTLVPSASPVPPTATPGPTASGVPTLGTPQPGDEQKARDLFTQFMDDYTARRWHAMWDVLGVEDRQFPTYDSWVANWAYQVDSMHGQGYQIRRFTHSSDAIAQWIPSPGDLPTIDLGRAFLVDVYYPGACCTNTDWEIYLVGPDHSGSWWVWSIR